MNEEILKVLKMVEEGKITSDKAAELIEALKAQEKGIIKVDNNVDNVDRMLKIKVNSKDGDDVSVNLPIKTIKGFIGAFGSLPIKSEAAKDIDMDMLMKAIDLGVTGPIVDVTSGDGDIVKIYIE